MMIIMVVVFIIVLVLGTKEQPLLYLLDNTIIVNLVTLALMFTVSITLRIPYGMVLGA